MILNLRSIVVGTFALSLLPWPAFAAAAGAPPPRTLERPVQLAQGHMRSGERMERHEGRDEHGRRDEHGDRRGGHPGESRSGEYRYWHGDRVLVVPPARRRVYRHVIVVRPHGHWYPGYGHFYMDAEAYKWLAFTAITLKILDLLNEAQERAHEEAQIKATTAPVGETITWNQVRGRHPRRHQLTRALLPGVPADRDDRRQDRKRLWHGVPPSRRHLGGCLYEVGEVVSTR
jgi:hypothetical protein